MYLSTDNTITSSDTQVGYDQSRSSINGGSTGTDSLSTSNRIPSTLNPGNYYWGFIVDIDDDVSESNENNNAYVCNQVYIEDELPDIFADSVGTSSSSVVMGDTITVSYRIENLGNDYTGSFHWELYLSSDSTITYSKVSGSFPGGGSINASTGAITGTESGSTSTTTYNFTIRATDNESQTADRAFTITVSHGASGGGQFN